MQVSLGIDRPLMGQVQSHRRYETDKKRLVMNHLKVIMKNTYCHFLPFHIGGANYKVVFSAKKNSRKCCWTDLRTSLNWADMPSACLIRFWIKSRALHTAGADSKGTVLASPPTYFMPCCVSRLGRWWRWNFILGTVHPLKISGRCKYRSNSLW